MTFTTCHVTISARRLHGGARTRRWTTRSGTTANASTCGCSRTREWSLTRADAVSTRAPEQGARRLRDGPQDVRSRGRGVDRSGTTPLARLVGREPAVPRARSSCSPTTSGSRSRWRAARRSTSSPTGFDAAYARAVEAAGDRETPPSWAAPSTAAARRSRPGCSTRSSPDVSPMMLGGGERLFDGIADPGLAPGRGDLGRRGRATHIRYRVGGA